MKAVKEYFKSVRFSLGLAFKFVPKLTIWIGFFFMIASVIPYANSYILGKLVDGIVAGAKNGFYTNIYYLLITYAALNTLPHILSNARRYILRHWRLRFSIETEFFFSDIKYKTDIAHLESPAYQDLIQRAFRNGHGPIYNLNEGQFNLLWNLTSFIVGTFLAIHFSSLIYAIVILTAIPGFIVDIKFASRGWTIWTKDSPEQRRFADLRQHFMGRTLLIETKLMQAGTKLMDWMRKILTEFSVKQLKNEKTRFWAASWTDALAFVGLAAGLFLVVREIIDGGAAVGSIVYMLGVLSSMKNSINSLLADLSTQYEDALIVGDMRKIAETPQIVIDPLHPRKLDLSSPPEIKFINVGFKYPNSDNWSLRNINLIIQPGSKIGLVGNNGAGKTTFVKLLCRIYDPTEGKILINDIDLKQVSIKEWWSYLGVMFQDYATYEFLAKEAIAIGRPDLSLEIGKVKEAAEVSQAHAFIDEWKDKYDQQIGVVFKGVEPSKGQRQKLSIAKIVYRNALLMILDEPTASVDAASEEKIFNSLENLSKSTTALLISHDFSTISQCDHIFVLEKGKLVEEGNHKELMKQKGMYAELYNLQAKRFKK
jgi:ABC-type multidrug transport system fused ATPase/permease subunit